MCNLFCRVDLESSDSGLYTCTAISDSGETSWTASLTVDKSGSALLHRMPDPAFFPATPSTPQVSLCESFLVSESYSERLENVKTSKRDREKFRVVGKKNLMVKSFQYTFFKKKKKFFLAGKLFWTRKKSQNFEKRH